MTGDIDPYYIFSHEIRYKIGEYICMEKYSHSESKRAGARQPFRIGGQGSGTRRLRKRDDQSDKVKSLNYLTGSVNRYQQEKQACPDIRMIVIYAGDIERGQVSAESDIGAVRMSIETVFLSELNSNGEILFK